MEDTTSRHGEGMSRHRYRSVSIAAQMSGVFFANDYFLVVESRYSAGAF